MAGTMRLSADDHARVTRAVAAAEQGTDGEIVTIVAAHSDEYHDFAVYLAAAAMLFVAGLVVFVPGLVDAKLDWLGGGWGGAIDPHWLLLAMLGIQAVTFLAVRGALFWTPLRIRLTPHAVKSRRVRRQAVRYFRTSAEQRTHGHVGILLYLSLDEHLAEIVADRAIHERVTPGCWGDAMVALVDATRAGDPAGGMASAVAAMGAVLAEHFPKSGANPNELPDRLIEL